MIFLHVQANYSTALVLMTRMSHRTLLRARILIYRDMFHREKHVLSNAVGFIYLICGRMSHFTSADQMGGFLFSFSFFNSALRQDYFSSYETGQSVGRKRENPGKNHLAHPQAELGLSHMWPVRGSNTQ